MTARPLQPGQHHRAVAIRAGCQFILVVRFDHPGIRAYVSPGIQENRNCYAIAAMGIPVDDNLTDTNPFASMGSWAPSGPEQLFQRCLTDHLREGVVMVDRHLKVTMWNRAAETLTGIRGPGMINQRWLPSQVNLKDRFDKAILDRQCPVAACVRKAEQVTIAATVTGRGGRQLSVDVQIIPVIAHDRTVHGAVIILHDLSSQLDLEQQVLTLYAHATRDQLTGVANRAHFERSLDARIKEYQTKGATCSLIVADIDFFKKVNDDFGHHVGDNALASFAKILQQNTRVHDLVARYGGEEFVILCPDCHVDTAVERAEELRAALAETPIASLNGKCITASFGVTEFEPDDSAISAFVRADQALLNAKENGRNQVHFLQTIETRTKEELQAVADEVQAIQWRNLKGGVLRALEGETTVPFDVLIEKIKGFVSDHNATIVFAEPDHIRVRLERIAGVRLRRTFDRHTPLLVDLETRENILSQAARGLCTRMRISIRLVNGRDRRHRALQERVDAVFRDFVERLGVVRLPGEDDEESRPE